MRATDATPDDPAWDSQWNLRQIDWGKARSAADPQSWTTIAVLDTGIDASHPDSGRPRDRRMGLCCP